MPENSTTTPQNHKQLLLKKEPFRYFFFFWCWWFIWRKKNKLLIRVWMVYRALSLAWNSNLCACVCLQEERAVCQEQPAFPASDTLGWRGNRARKGECPVKARLVTQHTFQRLQPLLPTHSFLLSFVLPCSSLGAFSCDLRINLNSLELKNAKKEKWSLLIGKGRIILKILVLEEIYP